MKTTTPSMRARTGLGLAAILLAMPIHEAAANDDSRGSEIHVISQSAMLAGLEGTTVFPFIDTTPNKIRRAHIAVTDSTEDCAGGAAAPGSVQVLVGVAGGTLVPVLTAATNTGISIRPDKREQCVFHVTVKAGQDGIPSNVTDIVVVNGGTDPLTGVNTITVSAEVVRRRGGSGHAH